MVVPVAGHWRLLLVAAVIVGALRIGTVTCHENAVRMDPACAALADSNSTTTCPPNYDALGQGYDMSLNRPVETGEHVFPLTFSLGERATSARTGTFTIPDHTSLLRLNQQRVDVHYINSTQTLQLHAAAQFGLSAGAASSLLGGDTSAQSNLAFLRDSELYMVEEYYHDFALAVSFLDNEGAPRMTRAFNQSLHRLPPAFTNDTLREYEAFIELWGTHVVWRLVYGARVQLNVFTERCKDQSAIEVAAGIGYVVADSTNNSTLSVEVDAGDASPRVKAKNTLTAQQEFLVKRNTLVSEGGDPALCRPDITECSWQTFLASINSENIAVVQRSLTPLWRLPIPTEYSVALEHAVKHYLAMAALSLPVVASPFPRGTCDGNAAKVDAAWRTSTISAAVLFGVICIVAVVLAGAFIYRGIKTRCPAT